MKRIILYTTIVAAISLVFVMSSCSVSQAITVTIYNNTRVSTGQLHILYGSYQAQYADSEQYVYNPTFPYTFTIMDGKSYTDFFIYVELDNSNTGLSRGMTLLDSTMSPKIETSIDLEPYVVVGTDEYEQDNSFDTAHPIQDGEYQARTLSNYNDVDYIAFDAMQGRQYSIETVIPSDYYTSYAYSANINIFDPGKTLLASGQGSGYYSGSILTWTASYTGVCYIKISVDTYDGSYGLSLSSTGSANSMASALSKINEWNRIKK